MEIELADLPRNAIERATGSGAIEGNCIDLQFDGPTTFDRWIEAISEAQHFVHFENYILRDDSVGRAFRDVLVQKARQGISVRLIYDWVGCWATPRRYWSPFHEAGVEVRAFNRPSVRDPYGVLQRDHRKLVAVDGKVAFAGGFCIGEAWAGRGGEPPWRDTGLEIRGPAAAAASSAFERIWDVMGDPVPKEFRGRPSSCERSGDTPVWVIEGEPGRTRVLRTLLLIASTVTERLWITDPYFVAPRSVSEALVAAARQGVDVRVLLPAHNNWPLVGSLSRSGYRFLLENGVRLFEWQGPMIHAKTSVADGVWSRIGSSNLNSYSLLGNWEIDIGVMDRALAGQMEGLFLADLASSVEIVLPGRGVAASGNGLPGRLGAPRQSSLDPEDPLSERTLALLRSNPNLSGLRVAQLVRAGAQFGEALAGNRQLGPEDRAVLGTVATFLLVVTVALVLIPRVVAWSLAAVLAWIWLIITVRVMAAKRRARKERKSLHEVGDPPRMKSE
jgi:cardiolipin synthase A/B